MLIAFVFGACWGSFLGCLVDRWFMPTTPTRSTCDHCGITLPAWALFPVISWVFLRGKTHCCTTSLSPHHVTRELIAGSVCAVNVFATSLHYPLWIVQITSMVALWIAFSDHRWLQIPLLSLIFLSISTLLFLHTAPFGTETFFVWLWMVSILCLLQGITFFIHKKNSISKYSIPLADLFLMMILSTWFPLSAQPYFIFNIGVFSIIYGLIWRHKFQKLYFPFAPAIVFSWWVLMFSCG